jgi:acetyl esterase/lipase
VGRRQLICAGVCAAVTIAASARAVTPSFSDLPYATDSGKQKLDLYLPPGNGPHPTVVMIHGGGWIFGDKTDMVDFIPPFLDRGIAVANINYRLAFGDDIWPTQIYDCKGAVRWLRAHAATYHLDPQRFGAFGESAGGHLAAMLGVAGNAPSLEGNVGGNLAFSSAVQAMGDYYGPTDLWAMAVYHGTCNPLPNESKLVGHCILDIINHMNQPSYAPLVALVNSAIPMNFVDAADAPARIAHGTADAEVPPSQSQLLQDALAAAGVPSVLHLVAGAGHGLPASEDQLMADFFLAQFDQCPSDPNKISPGTCGCGVPDTDTDNDGTPDCNDLCPLDPLKIAPGICGCGVVDSALDSDGDGVPNCIDQCPGQPDNTDCNKNQVPDCIDIMSKTSADSNKDGIPDECQHPLCAADISPPVTGDGVVNPADLAQLLSKWSRCAAPCPADLFPAGAPDGTVGPGDLAQLLAAWGQCR